MATYKRIDGDYNITTLNALDNVNITTHTVKIFGNLDVGGNVTYINVDELNIRDPFILLNSSNTSTYASNSGILTHRTASDFAGLRWSNTTAQWEISSSTDDTGETGSWVAIATGNVVAGAAGSNTEVQFNNAGSFGASTAFTFDEADNKLTLTGHLALGNIVTAPAATANTAALYHNQEGSGGTGVYVKSTVVEDELVSKSKAIVFAIIF
jgi:hypothetical protein